MNKNLITPVLFLAALAGIFFLATRQAGPLSLAQQAEIGDKILVTEQSLGTEAALQQFSDVMDRYKLGFDFCHPLASRLGADAVGKAATFSDAVSYPRHLIGYCTGGFIHGAAQEYLEKSAHLIEDAGRICDAFKEGGSNFYVTCVHGVGHGVMAGLHNDLPAALKACGQAFGETTLAMNCREGVFMQNFDAGHHDDSPVSEYMKTDDIAYPCPQQPEDYKARCYNHVAEHFLDHYPKQFSELLSFCMTVELDYRFACYRGAGRRIVQNNIDDPKRAEAFAGTVPGAYVADYIYGVAIGYQEFFPEPGKGGDLCRWILDSGNRGFCPPSFR